MTLPARLSQREAAVAALLLEGKSNKQIAAALGLTVRTVEFHLSSIYAKLHVSSRTEAALKLANQRLRESTGAPRTASLRESTVESATATAENGENFHPRSFPMLSKPLSSSIAWLLIAAAALVAVAALALFALSPKADYHYDDGPAQEAIASASQNLDRTEMNIAAADPAQAGTVVLNQYLRAFRQSETHDSIRLTAYEIVELKFLEQAHSQLHYIARVRVTPQDAAQFAQNLAGIFTCETTPDGLLVSFRFTVFQQGDHYKLVDVEPFGEQ